MNISGVSKKEGRTEKRGHKVYAFDYATGTLTGFPNSSVTNWNLLGAYYRISLYCTADLRRRAWRTFAADGVVVAGGGPHCRLNVIHLRRD